MNTQRMKISKSGVTSAVVAAAIAMTIVAIFARIAGEPFSVTQTAASGLRIGLATFAIAFIIGGTIRLLKATK